MYWLFNCLYFEKHDRIDTFYFSSYYLILYLSYSFFNFSNFSCFWVSNYCLENFISSLIYFLILILGLCKDSSAILNNPNNYLLQNVPK